ncbi:hypothetical protein COV24_03995 [candidate division WWE3 bacterium CG10_big_fil_rev_8_21_14_0_10_32_10]|uniref:Cohesin domain-containing protein n=1 Tax=candidate division WWE3 bacterium CG10_big_fil_rev_8_21_14_0_10_32_10 TaxID=1975090 RepID=A0A2H0R9I8_UNCKA|nr:MAG: hypothetical protein COV24_03995 [candidate division WWE3 bacterium CG10_big_fil_rev_8_21_14_0_10_32_10]
MTLPHNIKITRFLLINILLVLFLVLPFNASKLKAAEIYVNPATGTVDSETFTSTITLDPTSNTNIQQVKVYIKYNPQVLEVTKVSPGDFDSYQNTSNDEASGIIEINASNSQVLTTADIVKIVGVDFKPLANNGFADIEVLNTETYQSQVLDSLGTNLLTNTNKASLLLDIQQSNAVQNVQNTNNIVQATVPYVPKTGTNNNIPLTFISLGTILVSYTIRKSVKSKY